MAGMLIRTKSSQERGAELLEFAVVIPILIVLCLGVIEFGRVYYTYNILAKSLRDGARYAATTRINSDGTWVSGDNVVSNTKNLVTYGNVGGTGTKIIPDLLASQVNVTATRINDTEQYINVSAAYPYKPLFSAILPATLTLSPSVRMQFIGMVTY